MIPLVNLGNLYRYDINLALYFETKRTSLSRIFNSATPITVWYGASTFFAIGFITPTLISQNTGARQDSEFARGRHW